MSPRRHFSSSSSPPPRCPVAATSAPPLCTSPTAATSSSSSHSDLGLFSPHHLSRLGPPGGIGVAMLLRLQRKAPLRQGSSSPASPLIPPPSKIDIEAGGGDQFQCRICLEADGRDFIAPCKCKGTSKYVHRDCLDHWRVVKLTHYCPMRPRRRHHRPLCCATTKALCTLTRHPPRAQLLSAAACAMRYCPPH
ncbi:hypothetical protein GUJ93_ZPchr0011g28597 [Zizania palustris]|uniref:RING-CH-type domain-containing protein n=1 Tax=Zizania palustris TaxID=103762 RepID=A0A8J6BNU2_ZIZPA|nr:hypothetical protein GUJ93_ZPchr0011g28597 [Zizania palustris]